MSEPFKMKGHALPGPNQRSALKATWKPGEELENVATERGIGDNRFSNSAGLESGYTRMKRGKHKYADMVESSTQVGEGYEGGEDYNAVQEAQNTQSYVDTGMDDSGADTLATEGDTAKKKVDVEVTVNDKKI